MQHGLEQWLTFLSTKSLPVLSRTKKDVQALMNQSQLSITQYAGPIVYDAGFCVHIFRHVNTQREEAGKNPLTTVTNSLSHLGQTSFQRFLNQTQTLDDLALAERNYQGYMRVMGQACHGALQAVQWAVQRNVLETEETQLAALLQNVTELMLWCYGEDAMPKIEHLCYVKKLKYEAAAKEVLGCGMRELGAKLAQKWHLPEMATDGLLTDQNNFTLATGVSLAAELARIVSLNWFGKEASDIVQRIAKHKGKTEGEVAHVLHLNAVNVNDVLLDRGFASPAKILFLLADDNYIYPEFIYEEAKTDIPQDDISRDDITQNAITRDDINQDKTPSETKVSKSAVSEKGSVKKKASAMSDEARKARVEKIKAKKLAEEKTKVETAVKPVKTPSVEQPILNAPPIKAKKAAVDSNKKATVKPPEKTSAKPPVSKELAAAIKTFQQMVSQAKPAHDLIEHAVKTCLLCGVQRCVFLVKLPNKEWLVSRYNAQTADGIALESFKIPVNKPHVFKLLMEKSRGLFLNQSNAAKYWNFIPEPVKLAIGVKSFFAMSVFVNNHAMGLMYADKIKGELKQEEFAQFQAICRLLSKGIVQSAQNKKK